MRLTAKFQLAAKTKQELRGLYRTIFNKIADPKISQSERQLGLRQLRCIHQLLSVHPSQHHPHV